MQSFTYSNARQNLSKVLDTALSRGEVKIRRRDGTSFVVRPETHKGAKSPLDIKGVNAKRLSRTEIVDAVKQGRKAY